MLKNDAEHLQTAHYEDYIQTQCTVIIDQQSTTNYNLQNNNYYHYVLYNYTNRIFSPSFNFTCFISISIPNEPMTTLNTCHVLIV